MSDFLKSLKKDLEDGEFNSEAAKRINEINELANKKTKAAANVDELEESVQRRLEEAGIKEVSEDMVKEQTTEYEEKMTLFKQRDQINCRVVLLSDYKDSILSSITDLLYRTVEYELEVKEVSKKGEFEEGLLLTEMIKEVRTIFKDWVADETPESEQLEFKFNSKENHNDFNLKYDDFIPNASGVEVKSTIETEPTGDEKVEENEDGKGMEVTREELVNKWEESGLLDGKTASDKDHTLFETNDPQKIEKKDDKKEE